MLTSSVASAQSVVNDPAVTLATPSRPSLKESLLNTQREQRRQLRRMAQRLSVLTTLDKYVLPDAPRWRTHDFENPDLLAIARDYARRPELRRRASGAAWRGCHRSRRPPRRRSWLG